MKLRLTIAALAALLMAGSAAPAHAQRNGPPPGGQGMGRMGDPQRMNQMLFEGITLSTEQQARVKAVDEKFQPRNDALRNEMRSAMQGGGAPNPALREKMTALTNEHRAALREVLTADQQKVFDANVKKMSERRGPPR